MSGLFILIGFFTLGAGATLLFHHAENSKLSNRISTLESRLAAPATLPAAVATAPVALQTQDIDIVVENTAGETVRFTTLTGQAEPRCTVLADANVVSCRINAQFETRRVGATLDVRIFRFQVQRGDTGATLRSGNRCFANPAMRDIQGFRVDNGFGFFAHPTNEFIDGSASGDCNLVIRYENVESADPGLAREAYLSRRRHNIEMDRRLRESEQRLQQLGVTLPPRPTRL